MAYGTGTGGNTKKVTIDVADTVVGDAVDFTMNGDIFNDASYINAAFIKTGTGTMEMNGTISTTNLASSIVEGTLLINKSGATIADVDFDLQGGTLALAAGTANTMGVVNVTAGSTLAVGAGASVTMENLTAGDGVALAITFAGDIDSKAVKVNTSLDAATLAKVRLNGRHAKQSSSGYLYTGGLMLIVR